MFASERVKIIKGILIEKKHATVNKLSEMLGVSEVTIRRDFEKLEEEGFLVRTHGGAYINDETQYEEEEDSQEDDPYYEDRVEISKIAVQMIEDEDSIILTSGKTNLCIAKRLVNKKRNLTVLTNDINIASELSANANIKITMPGGELNPVSMTLSGKLTEEDIKKFFVAKAFIEVEGASIEHGFTVKSVDKASIIREILSICKEKIFVCHYRIFDNIAFYQVGSLKLADKVITNINVKDNYKNYFFDQNLKLFTSIKGEGDIL